MQVSHASTQQEAGSERKVNCVVEAVAIGDIANRMNGVPSGARVSIEGFLGNKFRSTAEIAARLETTLALADQRDLYLIVAFTNIFNTRSYDLGPHHRG